MISPARPPPTIAPRLGLLESASQNPIKNLITKVVALVLLGACATTEPVEEAPPDSAHGRSRGLAGRSELQRRYGVPQPQVAPEPPELRALRELLQDLKAGRLSGWNALDQFAASASGRDRGAERIQSYRDRHR